MFTLVMRRYSDSDSILKDSKKFQWIDAREMLWWSGFICVYLLFSFLYILHVNPTSFYVKDLSYLTEQIPNGISLISSAQKMPPNTPHFLFVLEYPDPLPTSQMKNPPLITTKFFYYSNGKRDTVIEQSFYNFNYGKTQIMMSDLTNFDYMIVEINATGNTDGFEKIKIHQYYTSPEFANQMRIICRHYTFALIVICSLYALGLYCNNYPIDMTNALALSHMVFTILTFFMHGVAHTTLGYLLELFCRGISQTLTLLSLFMMSYVLVQGDNIVTTIAVGSLAAASDGLAALSADCAAHAKLFDSIDVIWVFFFSVSLVAKFSLGILTFGNLIRAFVFGTPRSRAKVLLATLVFLGVFLPHALDLERTNTGEPQTPAVAFLLGYLVQALAAVMVLGLSWPSAEASVEHTLTPWPAPSRDDLVELIGAEMVSDKEIL